MLICHPKETMDILRNLINSENRGDPLKNHLLTSIITQDFILLPLIQYRSIVYQLSSATLDGTGVKNSFPENHQQALLVIRIIRSLCASRILELSNDYERNRRLATVLSRPINPHTTKLSQYTCRH